MMFRTPSGPGAVFLRVRIAFSNSVVVMRVLLGVNCCGLNRKGCLFTKFSVSNRCSLLNRVLIGVWYVFL